MRVTANQGLVGYFGGNPLTKIEGKVKVVAISGILMMTSYLFNQIINIWVINNAS